MPSNTAAFLDIIQNFSYSVYGFFDANLLIIKAIFILISLFFLVAIVYINVRLNITGEKVEHWMNVVEFEMLSKRKSGKAWQQIQRRLEAGGENNMKLAILEADRVLEQTLKLGHFSGASMNEILALMTKDDLYNIEEVRNIHALRNKIVSDQNFHLPKEQAEEAIDTYKNAFITLGLIEVAGGSTDDD